MPLIPFSMIVYIQFDYNSIIINLKNISKGRNIGMYKYYRCQKFRNRRESFDRSKRLKEAGAQLIIQRTARYVFVYGVS